MRNVLVFSLTAVGMIAISALSIALAQGDARAMIVGAWEGTISFGPSWPAAMEFSDDAGTLRWKASFKGDERFYGDAEGTVIRFSPPALELVGAYTKHSTANARGTRIRFTLTLDGNRMTGTAIPEINNLSIGVSLTKKP
jgi:hypothetical protein